MTREQHNTAMRIAGCAGGRADWAFACACKKAGIDFNDALIGSPLLNLHVAQKKRAHEIERERYAKRKAARAA